MVFTAAGSTTCSSAVESLLFLSGKFIMMGGCSSMLRLYLPLSRPVWFYAWPLRCYCNVELASPKLPFLLFAYVGIRQAKMAAIAGTRPSITTNAIIIEMIAAIFSWQAYVGVGVSSGSGSWVYSSTSGAQLFLSPNSFEWVWLTPINLWAGIKTDREGDFFVDLPLPLASSLFGACFFAQILSNEFDWHR